MPPLTVEHGVHLQAAPRWSAPLVRCNVSFDSTMMRLSSSTLTDDVPFAESRACRNQATTTPAADCRGEAETGSGAARPTKAPTLRVRDDLSLTATGRPRCSMPPLTVEHGVHLQAAPRCPAPLVRCNALFDSTMMRLSSSTLTDDVPFAESRACRNQATTTPAADCRGEAETGSGAARPKKAPTLGVRDELSLTVTGRPRCPMPPLTVEHLA